MCVVYTPIYLYTKVHANIYRYTCTTFWMRVDVDDKLAQGFIHLLRRVT